jgi:hypothetical protein
LAAIFLSFLFCGVVSAKAPQDKPLEIEAGVSLIYDNNVFAYSAKLRDAFRANLRPFFFQNQNTNSLEDLITKPYFELHFSPRNYFTEFSAGVSGSFYRQNGTLDEHSYFIKVEQGLGAETDIAVTHDELFVKFTQKTFRTVGVDLQHDFKKFEGNIFAEGSGDDRNYGVGITTSIPSRYVETTLSYEFDQYVPVDRAFAYQSHQFRVEPIFPITEALSLNLRADIQKDKYTTNIREDTTRRWGFLMNYAMGEKFTATFGLDHIRWNTDDDMLNVASSASYKKNIITIKVVVFL